METPRKPEQLSKDPSLKRSAPKRTALMRASLLFTLSLAACSSPSPEPQDEVLHSFWQRERIVTPKSPWGEHEALVTRTRQNLTLYIQAILEHGNEDQQLKAMREVTRRRTEIKHYELVYLGKDDSGLVQFLKWLKETNKWALVQRDGLQ